MNIIRAQDGVPLQVLSDRVCIKLPSERSPNRMAIVTVDIPPGSRLPSVRHAREEEVYYVLDGRLTMAVEGAEAELGPGDIVHVAPGVAHGYRNDGASPVRLLTWTVGGAMDMFFVELAEQVRSLPEDAPALQQAMARFGVTPA